MKIIMKKRVLSLLLLLVAVLGGIAAYRYFFKSWDAYYKKKLYQDPRPLIIKAVKIIENERSKIPLKALDLGAGVGNDAAFVLKQGWQLWAVDAQKEAIAIMASRHDIKPYSKNLTFMHAQFEKIDWAALPVMDFIYSSYGIPFTNPAFFAEVWQNITNKLKSGGIFAAHFFGQQNTTFNAWEKRTMTFLTEEQVRDLFKDFTIDYFEEFQEKTEKGAIDHSFEVIARKK